MFGLFESKEDKKDKLVRRGLEAMASGDYNSAERSFLKAIEADIFNAPAAWIGLGSLYLSNNLYGKAKGCFESAIGQAPDDFHAIRGLAYSEHRLGNNEQSLDLFKKLQRKFNYKPMEDPLLNIEDRNWLAEYGM